MVNSKALQNFKIRASQEVGINLDSGYNGDMTCKQAGMIGGQMVKKMVEIAENQLTGSVLVDYNR